MPTDPLCRCGREVWAEGEVLACCGCQFEPASCPCRPLPEALGLHLALVDDPLRVRKYWSEGGNDG